MTSSVTINLEALADAAHIDAILRCWTREHGVPVTANGILAPVPGGALELRATVTHASRNGMHSFSDVTVTNAAGESSTPTATRLLDLLTEGADPAERALLLERTAESIHNVAAFAAARRTGSSGAALVPEDSLFLPGERSLLLGHLQHPAPKSRDQLTPDELEAYSPELTGRFQLHWFEAHESVVAADQVPDSPALAGKALPQLLSDIAGRAPAPGHVLVPAHPWQARAVLDRPAVQALIRDGKLRPLGPLGDQWWATSSLRTLFHPDHPVMLKVSVGMKITNSVREATATELRRGVEVNHLVNAGHLTHADPGFSIVQDPAWAAVLDPSDPTGGTLTGLDVSLREVPEGIDRFICLAGLIAPSVPEHGVGGSANASGWGPSHLARWCQDAPAWLAEYIDRVLVPMVRLYAGTGIGLEGHQQNTLVRLDARGNVVGGAYRDNQGYYLAASRRDEALRSLGSNVSTLAVLDDAIVDDRLTYYLLHNQLLSLVAAMATENLAAESRLLDVVRERLRAALPALAEAGDAGSRLVNRWLTAPTLPCKAHLATRLAGIDEVVAPLDAQSVYLDIPNPLAAA